MARAATEHERFMRQALRLAERGRGTTRPNPVVGAVVVRDGRAVSTGFHQQAGSDHAEVSALRGADTRGADLYVSLEPCCHHGRTGPCTEAIVAAGVRRVFVGCVDPNPLVSGRGIARLREAGVEVVTGVAESACRRANEAFFKHVTTGRPFVTLKLAASLDGRIATHTGDARWVTGERSLRESHRLRAEHDAVLVGRGTVQSDDPEMTVRRARKRGTGPVKVILDSSLRAVRPSSALLRDMAGGVVVATTLPPGAPEAGALAETGAKVVTMPKCEEGVEPEALLDYLGGSDVTSLLVEGGGRVAASFLRRRLVDRLVMFLAPRVIGGDGIAAVASLGVSRLDESIRLENVGVRRVGEDLFVEAVPMSTGAR